MRCSFEIFLREGGRNRRLLLASQNCYFLCRRDNFGIEATRYVSTHRSYMCLKCLILNVSFSLALFSPQIFFPGTLTCARRILIFPSKIMCNLFWFSRRSWRPRQMWNPPPLTCCCWGQQQVSGGFLVIFFRMNSVLSVRYVLYDLLGIMKNLAYRRFNSLRTRAEGRSQGTIQNGGPKGRHDDIYITKNIIFLKTNKKEMKESILNWFDRDRASIFIILKMPRNGVTIHARRYTSSGILTRKTASPSISDS